MLLCAMNTGTLLSLIFVPVLIVFFVAVLLIMLMRRAKPDTMIVLMYELKMTLKTLTDGVSTVKELKKLDMRLSRLQLLADRAGYEDEYDIAVVLKSFDESRQITSALYRAERTDAAEYLAMIEARLSPAAEYLSAVTGIDLAEPEQDFKLFSAQARRARAEKFLESVKK